MAKPSDSDMPKNPVDSLRITKDQHHQIIAQLNEKAQKFHSIDLRIDTRYDLSFPQILVEMYHPGGTRMRYLARPRNISTGGIAFLHGGFCYTGTPAIVTVPTLEKGKYSQVVGKVHRCSVIEGRIHEVAVIFDQRIDVTHIVEAAKSQHNEEQCSRELPRLLGSVLFINSAASNKDLPRFLTDSLKLNLTTASNGADGIKQLKQTPFDLVVTDLSLKDFPGDKIAEALKQAGYSGAILGLSQTPTDDPLGCTEILAMPCKLDQLVDVMSRHLPRDPRTESSQPLLSTQWEKPERRSAILDFLSKLESQVASFDELVEKHDNAAIQSLCLNLGQSALDHGFPAIKQAAEQLKHIIDDELETDSLTQQVQELARLASAACAGPGAQAE